MESSSLVVVVRFEEKVGGRCRVWIGRVRGEVVGVGYGLVTMVGCVCWWWSGSGSSSASNDKDEDVRWDDSVADTTGSQSSFELRVSLGWVGIGWQIPTTTAHTQTRNGFIRGRTLWLWGGRMVRFPPPSVGLGLGLGLVVWVGDEDKHPSKTCEQRLQSHRATEGFVFGF